mgnify:CR=1 FL=1
MTPENQALIAAIHHMPELLIKGFGWGFVAFIGIWGGLVMLMGVNQSSRNRY